MTVAPALRASSAMRRELASMLDSSMTPLTASCRAPPSLVKSFWYSIRTTAVFAGSTSMMASRGGVGSNVAPRRPEYERPCLYDTDACQIYVVTVTVTVGPGIVMVIGGPWTVVVGPVTVLMTVATVVTVLLIVMVLVCVCVAVDE